MAAPTWSSVWSGLGRDVREEAARVAQLDAPAVAASYPFTSSWLARTLNVRLQYVRKMDAKTRLGRLVAADRLPVEVAQELLVQLHMGPRKPLMVRFFDACGFRHEDGVTEDGQAATRMPQAALVRGIEALKEEDAGRVNLLLDCLECVGSEAWRELAPARVLALPSPASAVAQAPPPGLGHPPHGSLDASWHPALASALTTLDVMMIDAVLGSLAGQEGALGPEQAHDLVQELLDLNFKRETSWFHLGFIDVLQGRPVDPARPQSNTSRVLWYLAGALSAMVRRGRHDAVVELCRTRKADVQELVSPASDTLGLVGLSIFQSHAAAGVAQAGAALFLPAAVARVGVAFMRHLIETATDCLHQGKATEAARMLDLADDACRHWPSYHAPIPADVRADLGRRRAHACRLRGDLRGAERLLRELLEGNPGPHASRAHADLGLIASGHKELAHVEVPLDSSEWRGKAAALALGRTHFEASCMQPEQGGAHGHYCLAVLHLCTQGDGVPGPDATARARPLLEVAFAEMQANEGMYGRKGVLDKVRFYLGVCLAYMLEPARAGHAVDLMQAGALGLGGRVPTQLLCDALRCLAMGDMGHAQQLVAALGGVMGDRTMDAVLAAGLLHEHPGLARELAGRMHDERIRHGERREAAMHVLAASIRMRDLELGAEAMDALEQLADDKRGRKQLLELLADRERWDPVWSQEDANLASARLYKILGDTEQAHQLLEEVAFAGLGRQDMSGIALAQDCVDEIASLGGRHPSAALAARMEAISRPRAIPRPSAGMPAHPVRVLFIGGDERQEQYDARLQAELRESMPHVTLDLVHPGWSSNWGRGLDQLRSKVEQSSVVVLMSFVRTLHGRALRKACSEHEKRWVKCTGHGYASILRTITEAVRLVGG